MTAAPPYAPITKVRKVIQIACLVWVIYTSLAAAMLPFIAIEDYLQSRDCRVAHGVDACRVIYVPAGEAP